MSVHAMTWGVRCDRCRALWNDGSASRREAAEDARRSGYVTMWDRAAEVWVDLCPECGAAHVAALDARES